jgi:type II secretory pathway component PulF
MSYIQRLNRLLKQFEPGSISDGLWLELLESGATSQEISWYFGSSDSIENRVYRLSSSERRQHAIYESHLSARMALWWVLKQRQDRQVFRNKLWQALAYPVVLFGMAFVMILLLNHLMVPRISGLFDIPVPAQSDVTSFLGLSILEIVYVLMVLLGLLLVVIPAKFRNSIIIRFYDLSILSEYRFLVSTRFVQWMAKGQQQGLSVQTILTLSALSNDQILSHWSGVIRHDLENGHSLSDAVGHLDQRLKVLFAIHNEDQSIDNRFARHYGLMSRRVDSLIKRWRAMGLGLGYLSFGYLIFTTYQIMFEPIRQLEQLV